MTATKVEGMKISRLETEISSRTADIENLREAILTLKAGRLRPVNPSADDAFTLLKELVGSAPQRLEERHIYEEKLGEAERALQLAIEACQQKTTELKTERSAMRSQQSSELVQQLLVKAEKFNVSIDESFELLAQMKEINGQISQLRGGGSVLRTSSVDLNEAPYCQISGESVSVRRRFDVKQGG